MKSFLQYLSEMTELPIDEAPFEAQRRKNSGYTKIVRIDARKFKERFEADRGETLNWNPGRMDRMKDWTSFTAYPWVFMDWAGRVDVVDGRHRISTAAQRGMSIKVAVPSKGPEIERQQELLV